jgi:uncharacterized small protein (DUF1192 family)
MTVRGRRRWRHRTVGLAAVLLLAAPLAAEETLDLDELDALLERMQQRIETWDEPARPAVEPPPAERVAEPPPAVVPERVAELEAALLERDERIAALQGEIDNLRAQRAAADDGDDRVMALEHDLWMVDHLTQLRHDLRHPSRVRPPDASTGGRSTSMSRGWSGAPAPSARRALRSNRGHMGGF